MGKKILKWLIQFDLKNELQITEKEVGQCGPIDQILDSIGSFTLKVMDFSGKRYMISYKSEEEYLNKTIILVARIDSATDQIVDMANNDLANVKKMAEQLMGFHPAKF